MYALAVKSMEMISASGFAPKLYGKSGIYFRVSMVHGFGAGIGVGWCFCATKTSWFRNRSLTEIIREPCSKKWGVCVCVCVCSV